MSCRYLDDYAWLACLSFFNGACAYCGCTNKTLTADHLVPQSQGGLSTPENIVPACEDCNEAKADTEWREFAMQQPGFSQNRLNTIFNWRRICRQARLGSKEHRCQQQR